MKRIVFLQVVKPDLVRGWYPESDLPIAPCVCVDQAYYSAVKGKPRPGDVVQLLDFRGQPIIDKPPCPVNLSDPWMAERHRFTHAVPAPIVMAWPTSSITAATPTAST